MSGLRWACGWATMTMLSLLPRGTLQTEGPGAVVRHLSPCSESCGGGYGGEWPNGGPFEVIARCHLSCSYNRKPRLQFSCMCLSSQNIELCSFPNPGRASSLGPNSVLRRKLQARYARQNLQPYSLQEDSFMCLCFGPDLVSGRGQ